MTEKYSLDVDHAGITIVTKENGDVIAFERDDIWHLINHSGDILGVILDMDQSTGSAIAQEVGEYYESLIGSNKALARTAHVPAFLAENPTPTYTLSTDPDGDPMVLDADGNIIAACSKTGWHFFADGLLVGRAPISGEPDPAAVGALHAALVRFRGELSE